MASTAQRKALRSAIEDFEAEAAGTKGGWLQDVRGNEYGRVVALVRDKANRVVVYPTNRLRNDFGGGEEDAALKLRTYWEIEQGDFCAPDAELST